MVLNFNKTTIIPVAVLVIMQLLLLLELFQKCQGHSCQNSQISQVLLKIEAGIHEEQLDTILTVVRIARLQNSSPKSFTKETILESLLQQIHSREIPVLFLESYGVSRSASVGVRFFSSFHKYRPLVVLILDTEDQIPHAVSVLKDILKPFSVNLAKYIFLKSSLSSGEPKIISKLNLNLFRDKVELTESRDSNGIVWILVQTFCFYCPQQVQLILVHKCDAPHSVKITKTILNIFPDLTKNLHGLSLTAVFSKLPGNTLGRGPMFYYNPVWKLLVTMGELMNFSINPRVHFDPVRYTPDENGKIGGFIAKVNELELAIGTGIAPNIMLSEYIETTRAYTRNQIAMLMKIQTKIISMASVLSIINEIFQGIIFIFLALIATLLAIDKLTIWRKEGRHCDSLITNITKEYKKVLFVLMEISYLKISLETFQRFRRFPARILLYTWWFFSILIISFHQATLTSKLVIPVVEPEVQQVSDLFNENRSEFKDWHAGVNGDRHMVEEIFRGTRHERLSAYFDYYKLSTDCVREVWIRQKYICFSFESILYASIQATPPEVQKRLLIKKTELQVALGVLALPKHCPFAETIDRRLEYVIQSGLLTKWDQQHKKMIYSLFAFVRKRALTEKKMISWDKDYIVEKQTTIVYIMHALLVSYCVAFVVFILEIVWYHRRCTIFSHRFLTSNGIRRHFF